VPLNQPTIGQVGMAEQWRQTHPKAALITIATVDSRISLTTLPGPNNPEITEGRGGWSEVTRPRRVAISEWTGPALHKANIELLLDGWQLNQSVEALEATMERLAPRSPLVEPPVVVVKGYPGVPANLQWSIQQVDPTDRIRRTDGSTVRVTLVVQLLEYRVSDLVVPRTSPAKRSAARTGASPTTRSVPNSYTVKAGDTLSSIAAQLLGSSQQWPAIATLNGIRDGNRLKVGQVLKLPASTANAGHKPAPITQRTISPRNASGL